LPNLDFRLFHPPRLWEGNFLLFKPPSILSWQPQQTKIEPLSQTHLPL
jgi:hypothetical protein